MIPKIYMIMIERFCWATKTSTIIQQKKKTITITTTTNLKGLKDTILFGPLGPHLCF